MHLSVRFSQTWRLQASRTGLQTGPTVVSPSPRQPPLETASKKSKMGPLPIRNPKGLVHLVLLYRSIVAIMSRPGAITFKGAPLTLAGDAVKVGGPAPDFTLHYFEDGMHEVTLADVKGKPTILSVVPSLDTPVCQTQTKKFNEKLNELGDKINALTVSLDLPFAMNRFCGAENITNIKSASDYQDRKFGQNWGMLIEELKILARGTFVVDASGTVVYAETVKEVTEEPNYDAAMGALKEVL